MVKIWGGKGKRVAGKREKSALAPNKTMAPHTTKAVADVFWARIKSKEGAAVATNNANNTNNTNTTNTTKDVRTRHVKHIDPGVLTRQWQDSLGENNPVPDPRTPRQQKIIDFETLLAWYNEQNAPEPVAVGDEVSEAQMVSQKQSHLKFLML